jgi:cyclase
MVELRAGTWAWLQPNGGWGETNAGLIVGDGASLLVDTLWDEHLAHQMLDAASPLLERAPLSHAVNTHRDGDHWWGNSVLPVDVEIWTSTAALREMAQEPPPTSLDRLRRLARLGTTMPGRLGRLSRYSSGMLQPFHFPQAKPRRPDHTFTRRTRLTVGGREIRLLNLGPAHTAGDVVVHVPDVGVVYAGDLFFVGVTPVVWHGPVSNWISALNRILSLDADLYVPGHGPPGTREDLVRLRDYWQWLLDASRPFLRAGADSTDIGFRLAADPDFRSWQGWLCPERLALNVLALHREFHGRKPSGHGPIQRARMFSHVADLHQRLEAQ